MANRKTKFILTSALFIIGIMFIMNSDPGITGDFLGNTGVISFQALTYGLMLVAISAALFAVEHSGLEKITLTSVIKKDKTILRLTKEAVRNQQVEREMNHLVKELSKGNLPGRMRHIENTDINYVGSDNGARLYYHQIGKNSYEIVGKSCKGRNQDQVIRRLSEIYSR